MTAAQGLVERDDPTVDLGAPAAIANLGMDGIGKIQRRGTTGQIYDLRLRREYIDMGGLELRLEPFEKIPVVLALVQQLHPLAHPDQAVLEGSIRALALLVGPVGGHAQLSVTMHVPGADLHLQGLVIWPHHGRVQGLIHVALGGSNVVVELLGDVPPEAMDQPQGGIAIRYAIDQNPHRSQIEDLFYVHALALHLSPDAIDVLWTSSDVGTHPSLVELRLEQGYDIGDIGLPLHALVPQEFGNAPVGLRLLVA